jgi:branched-chain amino acid transport system ATP-binding protein
VNLLRVRDLTVRFGDLPVLHDIALDVGAAEIVAVIGPNGAGKTTLLRTIAGVLRPHAGRISLAGERIDGRPSYRVVRRGLALVPEGRGIFADQTVQDNLRLGAVARSGAGLAEDMERALERFPLLRDRRRALAGTLSGGQQQMLAIARGLMARPRLLLLDEPSLGLAPRLVVEAFESVERIRNEGVAVLLVEQLAAAALGIADRGYVLDRGRVVASAASGDLAADPAIVAAYLGARRPGPEGGPRAPEPSP